MQNLYILLILLAVLWGMMFIITAIATQKMAKDFEIKDTFLAFIPFSQQYLQGKIADLINKNDNEWSCYKFLYPILTAITIVGYSFLLVAIVAFDDPIIAIEGLDPLMDLNAIAINAIIYMITFLIISLICLVYLVVLYKCHHVIFNEYDPKHAVLYTFLSVFFKVHPIILYLIKDKKTNSFSQLLQEQLNKIDDGIETLLDDDIEIIEKTSLTETIKDNKFNNISDEDIAKKLSYMIDEGD